MTNANAASNIWYNLMDTWIETVVQTWKLTTHQNTGLAPQCSLFLSPALLILTALWRKESLNYQVGLLLFSLLFSSLRKGVGVDFGGGIGLLNELWKVCWLFFFFLFLSRGSSVRRELLRWAFEAAVWSHFPGVQAGERCGLGSACEPEQVCLGRDEGYKP